MIYLLLLFVENLKIGCYTESASSRQFPVSPGDYNTWRLTPYHCVKLCGSLSYDFAALQNGNLCFCANTFNVSQESSANCNKNCTGDKNYNCGGTWANLVYNSTSFARTFVINYFSPLKIFEWVNMSAVFLNDSAPGLQVAFNIGDENGDSPGESATFSFQAPFWGKISVKAQPLNMNPKLGYSDLELYIRADPQRAELNCPSVVPTGQILRCIAKIYEGTSLRATWKFRSEDTRNISLPSKLNLFIFAWL